MLQVRVPVVHVPCILAQPWTRVTGIYTCTVAAPVSYLEALNLVRVPRYRYTIDKRIAHTVQYGMVLWSPTADIVGVPALN